MCCFWSFICNPVILSIPGLVLGPSMDLKNRTKHWMLMSLINDMIFAYKVCTSSHSIYYNVNTMKIGVLLFGGIPTNAQMHPTPKYFQFGDAKPGHCSV